MSNQTNPQENPKNKKNPVLAVPMQDASLDIWDKKYRLKDNKGQALDKDIEASFERVARALSDLEKTPELRKEWYEKFLWALEQGAIPAGRIMSNAGAEEYKSETSPINCVVSNTIHDSMDDIMKKLHEAALTLKRGSGLGYEFSTLRPKNAFVAGAGANTSGPLSFMDIYDKMCFTVSSAGGRRGAQMATFDVSHPDVMDFIKAKREDGRLRQFNLSLLITENFVNAVKNDEMWHLNFPVNNNEKDDLDLNDPTQVIWKEWPIHEGYTVNEEGLVACKIYRSVKARHLWDMIMSSTYDYAEPGFILIDKANEMNNNWFEETFRATNPCVTGDTRLHTQLGLVKVKDLYDSQADLIVTVDKRALETGDRGVEQRSAVPVFMTAKNAEIFKVTTQAGYEIKATKWHKFYTQRGKIELKDLKVGDELWIQSGEGQFGTQGSYELGALMGFVAGDGHFTQTKDDTPLKVSVALWGEDCLESGDRLAKYANMVIKEHRDMLGYSGKNIKQYRIKPNMIKGVKNLATEKSGFGSQLLAKVFTSYGMTPDTKLQVPEVVWQGNRECVVGYLQGLFQADGTVMSNKNSSDVRLNSSTLSLLKDVQVLLSNFGILSRIHLRRKACDKMMPDGKDGQKLYHCRENYELIIGGESRNIFEEKIGFFGDKKNTKLKNRVQKSSPKQKFSSSIISIDYIGEETVYDTTQNDKNNLIFEGIVTGNCGEQILSPGASCIGYNARVNSNFGLIKVGDAYKRSLAGEQFEIAVDNHFSKNRSDLRPATIVRTGKKELFEVKFKNGQQTELTMDHRVHTPNGWRELRDLSVGDSVHRQSSSLSSLHLCNDFVRGFIKTIVSSALLNEYHLIVLQKSDSALRLFNNLLIPCRKTKKQIIVSANHPAIKEISSYASLDNKNYQRGVLFAVKNLKEEWFEGKQSVCSEVGHLHDITKSFTSFGIESDISMFDVDAGRVMWNDNEKSRKVFMSITKDEDFSPTVPGLKTDMESALYGWLLTSGSMHGLVSATIPEKHSSVINDVMPHLFALSGDTKTSLKETKNKQGKVFTYRTEKTGVLHALQEKMGLSDYSRSNRRVPECILTGSIEQQRSFLGSVFSASGSVIGQHATSSVAMSSSSKQWLVDIQLMLLNFGVSSDISHTTPSDHKKSPFYKIVMQGPPLYHFSRYIGFPFCEEKQEKLRLSLLNKKSWLYKGEGKSTGNSSSHHAFYTTEIQSITSLGVQDVYDIEEPSTNTLIVDGLVIHNCLLGSINLTQFVDHPFTKDASFDWERFKETVRIFTRMLDNVVEINRLPLEIQQKEIMRKRRHGMGFLGLGSAMTMMQIAYGSEKSLAFTDEVSKVLAVEGWREALKLAKEKGPAPLLLEEFEVTKEMLRKRPEMVKDGYKVGDKVLGKVLHAKYSRYMQKIAEVDPDLVEELAEVGSRFTHHSSIAPTGTISLSFGNNASNGIEPSFAHHYSRNIIREGKKSKEKVDVYSFELLAYRHLINSNAMPYSQKIGEELPKYFISADDISPKNHVDVQAAAQVWIDSAISKTANVPTDYPYEDFKDIYMYAYEKGLKGCTTFRFNPEAFQGVLVKEQDLENTTYVFTLEDGSQVEFKGNEQVMYDGEMHTAANLFDALKEGYYGKF
mgnify:CR=1 FL=1